MADEMTAAASQGHTGHATGILALMASSSLSLHTTTPPPQAEQLLCWEKKLNEIIMTRRMDCYFLD